LIRLYTNYTASEAPYRVRGLKDRIILY